MDKLSNKQVEDRVGFPVNHESSIDTWRSAKSTVDKANDYRSRLGCVGEPLADALDKLVRWVREDYQADALDLLHAAAADARANLLEYVNDARQNAADEVLSDVTSCVTFDSYDIEVDINDRFEDVAERGFDAAISQIENQVWTVCEVSNDEL